MTREEIEGVEVWRRKERYGESSNAGGSWTERVAGVSSIFPPYSYCSTYCICVLTNLPQHTSIECDVVIVVSF